MQMLTCSRMLCLDLVPGLSVWTRLAGVGRDRGCDLCGDFVGFRCLCLALATGSFVCLLEQGTASGCVLAGCCGPERFCAMWV